nr:hypothetical protein [Tanacetum cinerariifolium]
GAGRRPARRLQQLCHGAAAGGAAGGDDAGHAVPPGARQAPRLPGQPAGGDAAVLRRRGLDPGPGTRQEPAHRNAFGPGSAA